MTAIQEILSSYDKVYKGEQRGSLWPRFIKARKALLGLLQGIDFDEHKWDEEGICDYQGLIQGKKDGIVFFGGFLEGSVATIVEFLQDSEGEISPRTEEKIGVAIRARFVSKDGREGMIKIVISNKSVWEAYWLSFYEKGKLRLEQVVTPDGEVLKIGSRGSGRLSFEIPGANASVPIQIRKRLAE